MELNTRYSGQYRGYNNTIPKYLQDKPRQFLVHCLSRISSAEDIPADYIKAGENPGEFYVRSLDSKDTWYNLSFVGNTCMPKCSCPDFSRTGLLCKHFFAVFKHNEDWQWEALPKLYRDNPHLCLDDAVILGGTPSHNPDSIIEDQPDSSLPTTEPQLQIQPKVTTSLTSEAMKCRETLKQITTLTYNVEDLDALKELGSSLQSLHDKFSCFQVTDENTMPCLKKKQNNEKKDGKKAGKNQTKNYLPLPVRRKRNRFANRVGQNALIMRNQYFVNVPVDGTIYVKKRKSTKLKKPKESTKGSQRQPLLPHFTNMHVHPSGVKRKCPHTEGDIPSADPLKKSRNEPTTNRKASQPPPHPGSNLQTTNYQANNQDPRKLSPCNQSNQVPPNSQSNKAPTSNVN